MPPRPRFRRDADEKIIAFLAEKGCDVDFTDIQAYQDLGPYSVHSWSWEHKPDGWLRRSQQIEDLDARVLQLAKQNRKRAGAVSTKTAKPQYAHGKKTKGPVIKSERKGGSRSSSKTPSLRTVTPNPEKRAASKQAAAVRFDVERDLASIARTSGVSVGLVRKALSETGSVLKAAEWVQAFKDCRPQDTDDNDDDEGIESEDCEDEEDHEYEHEEESDDEDRETTSSRRGPVNSKRRRYDDEEDDDEAPATPLKKRRSVSAPPPPVPKRPSKQSKFLAIKVASKLEKSRSRR
ncbi:hypothetical protein C8R45DRAFT_1042961 [Mycena sanguinolenta]|nr:hypothetical protein C8R45DRAFT_1042961 [Mycena sanguinolenta]